MIDRFRYMIGVLTLVLAVAGGVYLVNLLRDEDKSRFFRLHVEFRDVGGLLPGADVRYRGVLVGSVRHVGLRDDGKRGVATIVLDPGREPLARTNSHFWIVTPRFGGLTGGASGLDTLVRNAYLSFYTPDPAGVQLANGSSVLGDERPFVDKEEPALPPLRRGDLAMTLLVPENHGLTVGAEVRYRGVRTGSVRRVELARDGSHVRVSLSIDRAHRNTVTDKSQFWVARPRLTGALFSGINLQDISAILTPFVSYHTDVDKGLPAADGSVVSAETARPDITLEQIKVSVATEGTVQDPTTSEGLQLVRVVYQAIEEDWFSPNDEIRREGFGLMFEDGEGRVLVLTTRSICDGSYFVTDTFGAAPEIKNEGINVQLGDGSVQRALRTWVAADGLDATLLVVDVEANGGQITTTDPGLFDFAEEVDESSVELRVLDAELAVVPLQREGGGLPPADVARGATVMRAGKVVGLLGHRAPGSAEATLLPIKVVPEALRPRQ